MTYIEHTTVDNNNMALGIDLLLYYPKRTNLYIHIGESHSEIGAVNAPKDKPIAFTKNNWIIHNIYIQLLRKRFFIYKKH